jgi:hypothetical protein
VSIGVLEVEVWTGSHLRELIHHHFQVELKRFDREDLLALRSAIERIKGGFAFGESYRESAAQLMLMWHLGCWTIRRMRLEAGITIESAMRKGLYRDAAVVIADLSGFSSYVRDSPDDSVVQNALESFNGSWERACEACNLSFQEGCSRIDRLFLKLLLHRRAVLPAPNLSHDAGHESTKIRRFAVKSREPLELETG